jgi:hypothetical protein
MVCVLGLRVEHVVARRAEARRGDEVGGEAREDVDAELLREACGIARGRGAFGFRFWRMKLLHRCFTVNSITKLCSNFGCQVVNERCVSPDEDFV